MLVTIAFAAGATTLLAADYWQNKPFTDWSDKEVTKMLTASPWSGQVPLSMSGGGGAADEVVKAAAGAAVAAVWVAAAVAAVVWVVAVAWVVAEEPAAEEECRRAR